MFVVGLDVDTVVSFSAVTHFITIWPFAGNFKRRQVHPAAYKYKAGRKNPSRLLLPKPGSTEQSAGNPPLTALGLLRD